MTSPFGRRLIAGVCLAIGVNPAAWAGCDAGVDTCRFGLVWRDAYPGDHTCVSGTSRNQAVLDNAQAPSRRTSGPFGPDTCIAGYVWREAVPSDHVCVTVPTRTQTALENAAAAQGRNSVCRPVWGWADLHNHAVANEGFGGNGSIFFGRAFGPPGSALPHCEAVHGLGGINDVVGIVMHAQYTGNFRWGHGTAGSPEMSGWPRWDDLTHQAVHQGMLRRAVDGGLRLVVVHAVNNEWMCETAKGIDMTKVYLGTAGLVLTGQIGAAIGFLTTTLGAQALAAQVPYMAGRVRPECLDMPSVDRQINEAKAMERFIDAESGGAGKGWFRIVRTPEEAADVMRQDKLAVVLGIEVDGLFGCRLNATCSEAYVRTQLDKYFDMGVRHVFPVHFYDNAFAGSANGNFLVTNQFKNPMSKRDCTALGYEYDRGQCNARGLTTIGQFLIRELALRGMLIDVDHMSQRTLTGTLDILASLRYPPVSGHASFQDIDVGDANNEGSKRLVDLARIRDARGIVGIIPHQGDLKSIRQQGTQIPHACGNTSETLAQAILYAQKVMPGEPIALGTDLNGFASAPGPRFGPDACPGGPVGTPSVKPRLPDNFTISTSTRSITMPRAVIGSRTYDFNTDGLAHMGLMPDLLADLQTIGLTAAQMDPIFASASGYIRVWDRARDASRAMPGVRRLVARASPFEIFATTAQTIAITVTATDVFVGDDRTDGEVWVKGQKVGTLGVPFNYRVATALTPQTCVTETVNGRPKRVCSGPFWKEPVVNIEVRTPGYQTAQAQVLITGPSAPAP